MRRKFNRLISLLLGLLVSAASFCQMADDTLQARLVLIGDAGEFNDKGNHPVVASVKEHIKLDKKTTVLYLGDNIYKAGLPDEQSETFINLKAVLDTQINVARGTNAKVYMIPGNHDWDEFGAGGLQAVRRQQQYVDGIENPNVTFYPKDGCPGPVAVNLSDQVVLIMIDSQWWLHKFEKPGIESDCPFKTKFQVVTEIENLVDQNSKKLVIIATHHPLKSYGVHGGNFSLKQAFFPLTDIRKNLYVPFPIIGFIYPIARGVFGTPQDIKHPNYANMINEIEKAVRPHQNVIFVAGHEHNQQLIRDSGYYYIVSGAGAKESRVSQPPKSLFASDTTGFAVLEISKNKNVTASFYNVTDSLTELAYQKDLLNFSTIERVDPFRVVYVPYNADSITIAANPRYAKASALKRFFNGDNYRKEWATPVTMPVFKLRKSGMTIESLGGGKQTKTLTLRDSSNKRWLLRTIDKDLENLLPEDFRGTAAENYLRDFISTAHPYAPLIVPQLAKAANITVAKPKLFFIPNDEAFGLYRPLFANKVVMMEEKEPVPPEEDTKSTSKLITKMLEDNEHHVDQQKVLRARLLDILLADWDRHFDQWRFGETDTGKGKLYYPIPRDRDEALSFSDGLIIKFLSFNSMPFLKGFQKDLNGFKWQSYAARDFDRLFLNHLEASEWRQIIKNFQLAITDDVIHKAVLQLPPPIYAIDGKQIENKLRSRRDQLLKEGMNYYRFLSEEVNISGSNQKEYFKVSKFGKDGVHVRVYKRKRNIDSISVMYDRKFDDHVTKEIRFFGLGKDDMFEVDKDVSTDIKLRIVGGKGDDTFNIKGDMKNYLYDLKKDSNYVINGNKSKLEFSDNFDVNDYSITGYKYDRFYFPTANIGYNLEDGFLAGLGFSRRTYGFRKEPYASDQRLTSLFAFGTNSYQLKYRGDFIQVFEKTGLLINADLVKPVLNNFFGLGNNTTYNSSLSAQYYRVRYNYASADVLLSKRVANGILVFGAGPHIYHYWNKAQDNVGKILSRPITLGLDSFSVYQAKTYGGLKAIAQVTTLNNDLFPTRGAYFKSELLALAGIHNARPVTSLKADFTLYSSLNEPARIVSVVRMGGGHIFSKNYEYFQALNLGQNNFLRGFRKNRFAGRSLAYLSIEGRFKLTESKSYLLPGAFGFVLFDDVGRVWTRSESSKKWHNSVGGGLYYAAYNTILLSATVGFSREETLFNFTIGSKFNLNF